VEEWATGEKDDIEEGVSTAGTSRKPLKDGSPKQGCCINMKVHSRTKKEDRLGNISLRGKGVRKKCKERSVRSKVGCHSVLEGVLLNQVESIPSRLIERIL
jgi:hypothetical protein